MAQLIESRTEGAVKVQGGEYKVTGPRATIAKYVVYFQFGLVGLLMAGIADQVFPQYVRENKFTAGIFVWFLGNMISSALTNSGAFEIYLGEKLVWSTLQEGGLPSYNQLIEAFAKVGINLSAN